MITFALGFHSENEASSYMLVEVEEELHQRPMPYAPVPKLVYTHEFAFDPSKFPNCAQAELIQNRKYYVFKWKNVGVPGYDYDYTFEIKINRDSSHHTEALSTRQQNVGGSGNVETAEEAQRCGLGTKLMYICMTDADINKNKGVDVMKPDPSVKVSVLINLFILDPESQKDVRYNCDKVFYVVAVPQPPKAAKGYLQAGIDAGLNMLFTHFGTDDRPKFHKLKTEKALGIFNKEPTKFYDK